MRPVWSAAGVVLCLFLASAGPLQAGLYNTAEPALYPLPGSFQEFQMKLGDLRSIAVERPDEQKTLRGHYRAQVSALEARERAGEMTAADRVNLGAYYIRLLKYEDAVRVLSAAEAREPDNFMVLANLAVANHLADRLDRAIVYQQQALKVWPGVWPGFTAEQLGWYRHAERYYLTLLELRQQESRLQPGRPVETLDALFPHVRFVGPSGRYEAGELAPEQWDELPIERIPLVSQLLLWQPFDNRLYWLLAELLNAQGDVLSAVQIMDTLVGSNFNTPELRAHRQALRPVAVLMSGDKGPILKEQLLGTLAPRGAGVIPVGGACMQEAVWLAALDGLQRAEPAAVSDGGDQAAGATGPASATRQPAAWLPDWRTFLVGLGSGVVLTLLIGLQVRHSRRRPQQGGRVQKVG